MILKTSNKDNGIALVKVDSNMLINSCQRPPDARHGTRSNLGAAFSSKASLADLRANKIIMPICKTINMVALCA